MIVPASLLAEGGTMGSPRVGGWAIFFFIFWDFLRTVGCLGMGTVEGRKMTTGDGVGEPALPEAGWYSKRTSGGGGWALKGGTPVSIARISSNC